MSILFSTVIKCEMAYFIHVIDKETKLVRKKFAENHKDFSIDGESTWHKSIFADEQRFA